MTEQELLEQRKQLVKIIYEAYRRKESGFDPKLDDAISKCYQITGLTLDDVSE